MTSFEIDCPRSFHDCDKIDVHPNPQPSCIEFHLSEQGEALSVLVRYPDGKWLNQSGKPLTDAELEFVASQINFTFS